MIRPLGFLLSLACLASAPGPALPAQASEGWTRNPANGHWYRLAGPFQGWLEAEQAAYDTGAWLATCADAAENDWIHQTFSVDGQPGGAVMLGLTDDVHDGVWNWAVGEPAAFSAWASGEPDTTAGADYAMLGGGAEWFAVAEEPLPTPTYFAVFEASYPWLAFNGHWYRLSRERDWTFSLFEGYGEGGDLVTIEDATEEDWLWTAFDVANLPTGSAWIGYTDAFSEGNWIWVSGLPGGNENWASGQPDGGVFAPVAQLGWNGQKAWADDLGSGPRHGILEVDRPPWALKRSPVNGHLYRVNQEDVWFHAEEQGLLLELEVATVHSPEERDWIVSAFAAFGPRLWTGLNDVAVEGQHAWWTGEPATWFDWGPGQPDDLTNVNPDGEDGVALDLSRGGRMFDDPVESDYHGLLELRPNDGRSPTLMQIEPVGGQSLVLQATNCGAGLPVTFAYSQATGATVVQGVTIDLGAPIVSVGTVTSDAQGNAALTVPVPAGTAGLTVHLQAAVSHPLGLGLTPRVTATVL